MLEGFNWCQTLGKTLGVRCSGGSVVHRAGADAAASLPRRLDAKSASSGR